MDETKGYWLAIARGDGSAVGICRDPLVVRLALMRARDELTRVTGTEPPNDPEGPPTLTVEKGGGA